MNRIIGIIGMLLLITMTINAQQKPDKEMKEKLAAKKVAFMTEKMDLTVEEAEVFWPLYNEYEGKKENIFQQMRMNPKKRFSEMSDDELETMIDNRIETEIQQANLRKEYVERFKEILPITKVAAMVKSEGDFRREMLSKVKNRINRKERKERKARLERGDRG